MAEEEEKTIRVVDRRMFTPEGDLRPGFQPDEASAPPPPAPPAEAPERPKAGGEAREDTAGGETPFKTIIRSLATTAYGAMGLLPDPGTGGTHRDPLVARQMIDWLGVLEQKTRGNLSFEESDLLARVLYELRLAYVEVTRPPSPPKK
jgi:Domain of unknown function (DUF1844)